MTSSVEKKQNDNGDDMYDMVDVWHPTNLGFKIFYVALLLKGLWCKLNGFLISRLSIPQIVVHGRYNNFRIVLLYYNVCSSYLFFN